MVRMVFARYLEGKLTFSEITSRFPGKIKTRQVMYSMLRNPIYIGKFRYDGKVFDGEHEPILSIGDFEAVQNKLAPGIDEEGKQPPRSRPSKQVYKYLLQGMIRCHCRRYMTPYNVTNRHGASYYYYKCTDPKCKNAVNAERIDAAVLNQACALATDEAYIQTVAEKYQAERDRIRIASLPQLPGLKKTLAELQAKQGQINNAFLTGIVTPENAHYWNAQLAEINREMERIKKEIELLEGQSKQTADIYPWLMSAVSEWAQQIKNFKDDPALCRNLILTIVKSINCKEFDHYEIQAEFMSNGKVWLPPKDSNLD